jgi:nucleotide-binding universal stress UspA family protein
MGGTVVCDVTDPSAAPCAVEFASALGGRLSLRLVLVYVVARQPPGSEHRTRMRPRGEAERTLEAFARGLGDEAETRVAAGDHAETLARVAAEEGADLIVVGARPTGLGGRHLRWTLARELEAATPVPVLVAPPATRKRGDRRLTLSVDPETR